MGEQQPREAGDVDLRLRYEWKKIEAPKTWRARGVGDDLVGYYGGKTTRTGRFGQYEVVLVHVPRRGTFMISGVRIAQLIDAASIDIGWPVRIVSQGAVPVGDASEGKTMKLFDVFVAEGDPIAPGELPQVSQ